MLFKQRFSLFAEAVEGAAQSGGESKPRSASISALTKGKPLSATILKAFFEGSDAKKVAEKVAAAESSRLEYLFRTFPESSTDDVKTACKEYKADAEKVSGKKSPAYRTAGVRASNVQALYGAWRWTQFKPEGMGFHDAYAAAVVRLNDRNIKWDGSKKPEQWEKQVKKEVEAKAQIEHAVAYEQARREHTGEAEMTEQEIEQYREKAADQQQKAAMVTLAGALLRKYGIDRCNWLIESLETAIHQAISEGANKAEEAKKVA